MSDDCLEDILDFLRIIMLFGLLAVVLFLLFHSAKSWDTKSYLYDGDAFEPIIDYKPPTRNLDESEADYNDRQHKPEFLSASPQSRIVVFYSPWCPVRLSFKNKYIMILYSDLLILLYCPFLCFGRLGVQSTVSIMLKLMSKLQGKFKQRIKSCFMLFHVRYMVLYVKSK